MILFLWRNVHLTVQQEPDMTKETGKGQTELAI